jgi:glycine/D-amino acid oxidase-like deaminating enzyme
VSAHLDGPSRPVWWDGWPAGIIRPALTHDERVDVAIVGAGYTGLWTAYYLLEADPSLSVMILEAEHVGFGASGRNGGWVSALYPVGPRTLARDHGESATRDQYAALRESVDEVGRVAQADGIECGFHQGGTLVVARNRAQAARAQAEARNGVYWGTGTAWLDAGAAADRLAVPGLLGATFNPHCARIHPFALAVGLARAVENRGARIHERTAVTSLGEGDRSELNLGEHSLDEHHRGEHRLRTVDGFMVRARHVIRATEAWTARLPGLRRAVAPVYSLVVATAPLARSLWDEIGLADAETFSDHRHGIVYGQRSADDRIVFGGRGAPYHFGSSIKPEFDSDARVFRNLRRSLTQLIPATEGVELTHAWGGPLGIPRDWHPGVAYDPSTGIGHAGGYVGDGVALSNLAGRTLADLVTTRDTALTHLPWVQHRSRRWEPEPLRWLGVNAGLALAILADREEALTGSPALLGRALSALTAH